MKLQNPTVKLQNKIQIQNIQFKSYISHCEAASIGSEGGGG
jgi:hypothetical protein